MAKEKENNCHCNLEMGNIIGVFAVPNTTFEKGMSISDWDKKRGENARKLIINLKENIEKGIVIY